MRLPRVSSSEWLLRIAVAFAFAYPAIDEIFDPASWLGYFPHFILATYDALIGVPLKLSEVVLLHTFGLFEVALALWVLIGTRVRIPAVIMALVLFAIVGFNLDPSNFSVLFRDVSIALAALALASMSSRKLSTISA